MPATQALTLDATRPHLRLKGNHGLFGSAAWWSNVEAGVITRVRICGTIEMIHCAGQDGTGPPNSFDMRLDDGMIRMESMYADTKPDNALYQVGRYIEVIHVLEEMKRSLPNGGKDYLDIVFEVRISQE